MREILFRGKRKDGGIWLFGDLRQWSETRKGICDYELKSTSEVDPETVGQFTGLTDKNGKKIFDGDIVVYDNTPYNAYGHRVIGVIVWHKWAWRFKYKEYGSTYHYTVGTEDFFGAKSEVIGNIHDNPELLEDDEQ